MSQLRADRVVVGGRRATAGGRAQARKALGYNETAVKLRHAEVVRLRRDGLTFRQIGAQLGISPSQACRDFWGVLWALSGAAPRKKPARRPVPQYRVVGVEAEELR